MIGSPYTRAECIGISEHPYICWRTTWLCFYKNEYSPKCLGRSGLRRADMLRVLRERGLGELQANKGLGIRVQSLGDDQLE